MSGLRQRLADKTAECARFGSEIERAQSQIRASTADVDALREKCTKFEAQVGLYPTFSV